MLFLVLFIMFEIFYGKFKEWEVIERNGSGLKAKHLSYYMGLQV